MLHNASKFSKFLARTFVQFLSYYQKNIMCFTKPAVVEDSISLKKLRNIGLKLVLSTNFSTANPRSRRKEEFSRIVMLKRLA